MKIKNFKLNNDNQVIVKIIGEVLRAFHIEEANDYEPVDYDKFEISNSMHENVVKTKLTVGKDRYEKTFTASESINPNERRGAEIHRLVKKNLYKILTNDLKLEGVPYGIMHGVRPTKIIHRWLRGGFAVTSHGVIDRDRIARRLSTDYLASYNKSHLLTEVAIRQIPILNSGDDKTIGVYVGIPFCVTRCLYCSFPSTILPSDDKVAEFMKALTKDINAAAAEIKNYGFKVQSIYIGGGTPTALPDVFFREMMERVTAAFYSSSVEEFTVECGRPDTITSKKVAVLTEFHVTRVSVNPQSMQQKTLNRIGRQHSAQQVTLAYKKLRAMGKFQINMDLILGLPGETINDVKDSLEKVLALNPEDITLHALAIKRGSQLQTQLSDEVATIKDFDLPDDAEVRKMAELAEKMLRDKGYLPYYLYRQGYISGQIENVGYCKPGAEGIYNIQIMDERQTILGVGAAATTKVPDNENMRLQTSFNAKDLTTYLRDVHKYIENRSNTLAEIYNPSTISDAEIFNQFLDEIVEIPDEEPVEPVDEETAEAVEEFTGAIEGTAEFIEEKIKALEAQINSADENSEPVEETAESVEDKIKALEAQINSADENSEPVEEMAESVEDKIKALEAQINSADENAESVEETAESVEDKIKSLETQINSADENSEPVEETAEFVKAIEVEIEPTEEKFEPVEDKFEPVEEKFEPVEEKFEPVEEKFEPVEEKFEPVEEKFESVKETTENPEEVQPSETRRFRPRHRRNKKFWRSSEDN